MRILCNPLNLEYKFQHLLAGNPAHREAADPTAIYFKGRYYVFASMSGGFWYSDDLLSWKFHENKNLHMYLYAPDVRQIGDWMYFSASKRTGPSMILRTKDPLSDEFFEVNSPFAFWDPNLFEDDDKRVYFYWGCSNRNPIYGVEMDSETMQPIGERVELFGNVMDKLGWERTSGLKPEPVGFTQKLFSKIIGDAPFIEGAFMNKHKDKYYLQYAAPGTEIFSYGDGVYISDNPLGPFKMQSHNPFSTKPGGFIKGAGHGSTIQDVYGNWWHMSTMVIAVNAKFERRLGMFPCGFDKDDILYCNQRFADYPILVPEGKFEPFDMVPEWMLLSYDKPAQASSFKENHNVELGVNEDITNWWCSKEGDDLPWYTVDLEKVCDVHCIQINFADCDIQGIKLKKKDMHGEPMQKRYIDLESNLYTRYMLEASVDNKQWFVLSDKTNVNTNLCHDLFVSENPVKVRYIKVTGHEMPYKANMAISGLRVFGKVYGEKPRAVTVTTKRVSGMDAKISWNDFKDATGYNVCYGIAPDKLYSSWMVYGRNNLDLCFLNESNKYWIRVDAFNECGITQGETGTIERFQ